MKYLIRVIFSVFFGILLIDFKNVQGSNTSYKAYPKVDYFSFGFLHIFVSSSPKFFSSSPKIKSLNTVSSQKKPAYISSDYPAPSMGSIWELWELCLAPSSVTVFECHVSRRPVKREGVRIRARVVKNASVFWKSRDEKAVARVVTQRCVAATATTLNPLMLPKAVP